MSTERLQNALAKSFERQRIVFWYDAQGDWWPEFDSLQLSGVEKVCLQNNEFGVKHRLIREAPNQKFLLYFRNQARPEDTQNWLLDQLLDQGEPFFPDRASLALIEVGLPPEFKAITEVHFEFFRSQERATKLKEWLEPTDKERDVRRKMMAVVCKTEPVFEVMLLALLGDLAKDKDERWKTLEKFKLVEFWWEEMGVQFGYLSEAPVLLDFLLALFRAAAPLGGGSALDSRQAVIFVKRWQDSADHGDAFAILSERAAEMLNINAALNQITDVRALLSLDLYRRIDLRILADLRDALLGGSLSPQEIIRRAAMREELHWARRDPTIRSLYRALAIAAEIVETLPKLDLTIESFDDGIEKYTATWWKVDHCYRHFVYYANLSGQTALLEKLMERIEGLYVNEFLVKLALRWQEWVDRTKSWTSKNHPGQSDFFDRFIRPAIAEGRKVFVVISDALRYEAARELAERILREDRWTTETGALLGSIPSYTQLGMASLLPHETLEFDPHTQIVLADGVKSAGTEARTKILSSTKGIRATAITAEDFLVLNSKTDGRELARNNDVVYIYHNTIDSIGDKRDTEHKTTAAVEDALIEIIRILKKAAAMNISQFAVTSDHGFLYQNEPVADSDFLEIEQPDDTIKYDRRFIIAGTIHSDPAWKCFSAAELNLKGELQFAFPKGIQRLRLKGSGSRYVHGGTTLQEIVIPVLQVRKERSSDIGQVDVDIVRNNQQITTGQVSITFLQVEPVGEKCLPREIQAGFYSADGTLISTTQLLRFDSTAEDARQRERRERFIFGHEAEQFNQQEIMLRIEERVAGTSQTRLYKEFGFKLRRAFENDFE